MLQTFLVPETLMIIFCSSFKSCINVNCSSIKTCSCWQIRNTKSVLHWHKSQVLLSLQLNFMKRLSGSLNNSSGTSTNRWVIACIYWSRCVFIIVSLHVTLWEYDGELVCVFDLGIYADREHSESKVRVAVTHQWCIK